MNTKTINTRIGLKYDLYANWVAVEGSFIPKKGEVIFYEIPSDPNPNVMQTTPPAILFKVGDDTHFLKDLPWGSAIAADVYAWAKQQSLLGGTKTGEVWSFENTNDTPDVIKDTREEVAAFVKANTVNIRVRIIDLGNNEFQLQTTTSTTDDGWVNAGDPFSFTQVTYSAGAGLSLNTETNKFSIKLNDDNLVLGEEGLSTKVAEVTYTASTTEEGTTTPADLSATGTGLLDETAVGAIKSYVDAKAGEATADSAVTVEKLTTAETGYASSYIVKQNGTQVGATINIPKDYLVKSASLETCTTADTPVQGLKVGDKYIDFVVNTVDGTGTASHIYLPVKDLVDVYTGGETTFISVNVDGDNNITASAKTQLISGASGRTYTFTSYSAATDGTQYSTGKVEVVKVEGGKTYVKVIENNPDTDFVGNVYYVNSVFGTVLPTERLQLNEGSSPINVWVKLTGVDGSDVDGLATALDVKRYVGEQLAANVPNVEGEGAIVVDDTTGTTSKTVSLKLNDTNEKPSGLKQSDAGLEINDEIEWILNCGGAPTTNNSNDNQEQQ